MKKTKGIEFQRRFVVADAINQGKPIEGIRGYVPCSARCCCGGTTLYVPVTIVGLEIGGCEAALKVRLDDPRIYGEKREFEVKPTMFFSSTEEIESALTHLKRVKDYNTAKKPFDYHGDTGSRKLRAIFAELLLKAPDDLLKEIEGEAEEVGGVSKLPVALVRRYGATLVKRQFFPEALPDEEPVPDWDDE